MHRMTVGAEPGGSARPVAARAGHKKVKRVQPEKVRPVEEARAASVPGMPGRRAQMPLPVTRGATDPATPQVETQWSGTTAGCWVKPAGVCVSATWAELVLPPRLLITQR